MTKMSEIEKGLIGAIRDLKKGKAAKVHSPEALEARRRGRPPLPMVKVPVKIRLDADLLTVLRLSGPGWQTRINEVLRSEFMQPQATSQATSTLTFEREIDLTVAFLGKTAPNLMPAYIEPASFQAEAPNA